MTTTAEKIMRTRICDGLFSVRTAVPIGLAAGFLLVAIGCKPSASNPSDATAIRESESATGVVTPANADGSESAATELAEGHGHKPGQHGGIMVSLGRDSYHVEAVIEDDGTVRLYTLGNDETRVIDIESQVLKGYVKRVGASDSKQIDFQPMPQEGDSPNRTSLFMGQLPAELVGQQLDVTVPNVTIDGERFRLGFTSVTQDHGTDMPDAIGVEEERELYLAAAGHYTAADIEANGNAIPSVKFRGIRSSHDMNPKSGDKICPITETKANSQFTWVIGGKEYVFCCPPCIDEFVRMAKDSTDPMPAPEQFVKQ